MSLLLFDFPGCGLSEGEYVSLGWFESQDLHRVIEDAKKRFFLDVLILWGRSMGAVSCILYAEGHQNEVKMMVLDSPFSNLREMLIQIGQSKVKMPSVLISIALSVISSSITEKLGVNILDLEPGKVAERCNIPAMFIVAKEDEILPPKSVLEIYSKYSCPKKAILHSLEGGHASEREPHIIEQAFSMITDQISKYLHEQRMKASFILSQRPASRVSGLEDPFLRSARGVRPQNTGPTSINLYNNGGHRKMNSARDVSLNNSFVFQPSDNIYSNMDVVPPHSRVHIDPNPPINVDRPNFPSHQNSSRNILTEYGLPQAINHQQRQTVSHPDPQMNSHTSSRRNLLPIDLNPRSTIGAIQLPQVPQKITTPNLNASLCTPAYEYDQLNQSFRGGDHVATFKEREKPKHLSQCFSNQKTRQQENLERSILDASFENPKLTNSIGKSKVGRLGIKLNERPPPIQLLAQGPLNSNLSGRRLNFTDHLVRFN